MTSRSSQAVRAVLRELCPFNNLVGEAPKVLKLKEEGLKAALRDVIQGTASTAQISAFLIALNFVPMTPELLLASAEVVSSFAKPFPQIVSEQDIVLDIVGTGGDGLDSFNSSTTAALVVASYNNNHNNSLHDTPRIRVAKHGNRSSSGKCGSADLLEALGANIWLEGEHLASILKTCSFGFLFSQIFHPALRSLSEIRKELGIRTLFNLLGPLINPGKPSHAVIGVSSLHLGPIFAAVLAKRDHIKKAIVVHSLDGLDEVSPADATQLWIVENGEVSEQRIEPELFGLPRHRLELVAGYSPPTSLTEAQHNAQLFQTLVQGELEALGEQGQALLDFIVLNAAVAFVAANVVQDWREGATLARNLILSGETAKLIDRYVQLTLQPKQ
jgi:anthranilate phosphoribosyltransferase